MLLLLLLLLLLPGHLAAAACGWRAAEALHGLLLLGRVQDSW
jgi:hypothetical protein